VHRPASTWAAAAAAAGGGFGGFGGFATGAGANVHLPGGLAVGGSGGAGGSGSHSNMLTMPGMFVAKPWENPQQSAAPKMPAKQNGKRALNAYQVTHTHTPAPAHHARRMYCERGGRKIPLSCTCS